MVWKESKTSLSSLGRKFENPQERLLADLGRAARFFAPVRESLEFAVPSGCALMVGEAHNFLCEAVPLFEDSGFGVLVPFWWQREGAARGRDLESRLGLTGSLRILRMVSEAAWLVWAPWCIRESCQYLLANCLIINKIYANYLLTS